ncbi:restriction endonuclease subunit S [Owariibacterium komagatae]|uniref:restriction endonuclease subunit S n=1 Tax=Owariibacterium komagatae TaxID=3136601 RepID=UPI0038B28A43
MVRKGWKQVTLGDIALFQGGSQPPLSVFSSQKKAGYIRLVQIRDYKTDKYATYIPEKLAKRFCKQDDIMIGRYGPPIFQILRGIEGAYNVALIKALPQGVDKEFLYHTLKREDLFEYIDLLSRRTSGQTGVDLTNLKAFELSIPVLTDEQATIAKALSDVDSLISSLQKLIEKKKAIKQGTMQELLTGKKRLPGFSEEWSKQQLGDICNIVNGGTPSTSIAEFWNGKILWCTPTDITSCSTKYIYTTESKITESGLKASSATLLPKGALLLCSRATIGEVRIAGNTICTNQGFKSLVVHQNISNEWLYYMVHVLKPNMLEKAIGSTFLEISKKDLAELDIIVPEFTEQKAIAQVLSDMDSEIEQLEKKLSKYQQIKQGMMQELLTGRIRLVDADGKEQPKTQILQERQPAHNQHFDDAVMLAGIVNAFYSEKYPLGRKKVQKLLYLVRRKEQADISAFHKKAAGPYADEVRYKGGEPIAQKNKYIQIKRNERGSCFEKGVQMQQALTYLQDWGKQGDVDWLVSQFQYTSVNELELLATVDMAICDLRREGKEISVASIKDLIRSNKEWRDKLKKTYFRDSDIQQAIKKCEDLFES